MYAGSTEYYICVLPNNKLGCHTHIRSAQIGEGIHVELAIALPVQPELRHILGFFESCASNYEQDQRLLLTILVRAIILGITGEVGVLQGV